ncbi:hypothetical protein NCS52_01207100 [Fusarium sp. LHS14.1]|nr:hypothetical protein NCS52_01207100 [Fusarium sp. LHS14.1]
MSGKGILQGQASPIVDLEELYETTVEELQHLLGGPDRNRWSLEDEIRIDDWLVQLCVWGSDLDVESGALQKLREKEAVIVRRNLDLIRSSIAAVESQSSVGPRVGSAEIALNRLGLNIQNLFGLSNSLQIAIDLEEQKGPAFKVKDYLDLLSWKLAPPQPSDLKDVDQESSGAHTSLDTGMQDTDTGFPSDLLSVLQRCQRLSASGDPFWPDGLLKRIMTRDRVLKSLDSHAQESIDIIVLPEEADTGLSGQGLIKIYALLILLGKSDQILAFIEEGLLDKDLPLRYDGADFFRGEEALGCFQGWLPSERSLFDSQQWGFAVPSLRLEPDGSPKHYDLHTRTIIPWAYDSTNPVMEIAREKDGEVSEVHRITIDPDSQELWEPLQEMGLDDTFFALRKISAEYGDKNTFRKELDQLRMLSNTRYQHLVTLLASISYDGDYYLLFPYAECDLLEFWTDWHPKPPPQDMAERQWLIRQLSGLVGAMGTIHTQRGYHADICTEQIHCFRSNHDPRGVMVLTSYGIPSPNSAKSYSGSVYARHWHLRGRYPRDAFSQTHDLWSLGYVFLEFIAWFMGGRELFYLLESQWTSQPPSGTATPGTFGGYTTGGTVDIFGPRMSTDQSSSSTENRFRSHANLDRPLSPWTMREKSSIPHPNREAMECLEQLRLHQNRNSFTEEILSIIEKRMLSVVSTDADKTYYSNLQEDFRRLYLQCGGDLGAYPPPSGLVSSRREPPLASAESKTPNQAKINNPGQDDTGTLDVMIDTASGLHRNS